MYVCVCVCVPAWGGKPTTQGGFPRVFNHPVCGLTTLGGCQGGLEVYRVGSHHLTAPWPVETTIVRLSTEQFEPRGVENYNICMCMCLCLCLCLIVCVV